MSPDMTPVMIVGLVTEAFAYRAVDVVVALAPVAGLTLAAVFTVAAVLKLVNRSATVREFTDLGLPAPALLARIVPPAELVVAAALVLRPTAGALLATMALAAFTAVLVTVLRSGRSVSCGCLGAMSNRPVTWIAVARNGALVALAAAAATGPDPSGLAIAVPAAEVAMASGTAALIGLVSYQLIALRSQIGRFWSVELAGEGPRRRRSRSHHPQANNRHANRAAGEGVIS